MVLTTTDEAAFTGLYDAHRSAVHAYLLGRTSDPETAVDLLQETFLRVWRRLTEVRGLPAERQRAWIFTVARNLVVDAYRERATRRSVQVSLRSRIRSDVGPADDPEARALLADSVATVDQAVRTLPDEQREVLVLRTVGGLTSAEIGAALGVPAGTVRYRLSLARQRLAEALDLDRSRRTTEGMTDARPR